MKSINDQLTIIKLFILIAVSLIVTDLQAARLKDIANVRGVRDNQLIGYGLVVGLNGTGDSKSEYTNKSILRMLDKLGMKLESKDVSSKNIAAVVVTATLPPFSRAGNQLDVTVNSIGDASDLRGGTLVQTPLRAANQEIYVVAQGSILLGQEGKIHPTVGRIPNGGLIEKDVAENFSDRKLFRITLHNPDFTTAARVSKTLNKELGGKYAVAKDAGTVDVTTPYSFEGKGVELLATIESVQISPDTRAKVVVNEKTGTVVIGEQVRISKVAISHGDLTVQVGEKKDKKGGGDHIAIIDGSVSVGDLVKAMNQLGVSPKDLITILQSVKAAGALQGELEIL